MILENHVRTNLTAYVVSRTEALLKLPDYLEARSFLAAIPESLESLLQPPDTLPLLRARVDAEELGWAKEQRLGQVRDCIREQKLVQAHQLLRALSDQFPREAELFTLEQHLKEARETQCMASLNLQVSAHGYRRKEITEALQILQRAGGDDQERKMFENAVFEMLLRKKDWAGAGAFIRSLKDAALWSKDETTRLESLLNRARKENRAIEFDKDQYPPG